MIRLLAFKFKCDGIVRVYYLTIIIFGIFLLLQIDKNCDTGVFTANRRGRGAVFKLLYRCALTLALALCIP